MRITVSSTIMGVAICAFSAISLAAGPLVGPGVTGEKRSSGETIGADVGAGPHKERITAPAPRDADEIPAADRPMNDQGKVESSSTGSSKEGSSGADNDEIESDEERANRNKQKFKQRPGFKEDVPLPRS